MKIFYGLDKDFDFERSVVCVGSFDGVHKGHRMLIERMNEFADAHDAASVIVTFDPHPREVLVGDNRLLSTLQEKLILLREAGARNVVIVHFTREFSQTPHDVFVREILKEKLHARDVFVSDRHNFGRGKQGGVDAFAEQDIQVHYLPRLEDISSTAVREAIQRGDLEGACEMLADKYLVKEPVEHIHKIVPLNIDPRYVRVMQMKIKGSSKS